ncbi:hypothetical protein [Rasiella sp. SM2506]|uniref:hypothetical protein n=1 Tax=Rasiella sp. SM2506 TaxID=3423914 RepID=UPI003D793CE4
MLKQIILILLLIPMLIHSQEKFEIFRENKITEHQLGIDKYSFVHQICPDTFFMTELYHNLDYDEMTAIIKEIYDGVTRVDKVQVKFEKTSPAPAQITYSVHETPEQGEIYIMFTNFSNATRQFEEKPDPEDQLARWYFLKDDRLVYRKDLYSLETEESKLNSERKSDIIEYYIFDENLDNDKKIQPLIDEILSSGDNGLDNYFTQIYQIQYYLLNKEIKKAGEALNSLENYFFLNQAIPRNKKIYLNIVKAEYEVMTRL